MTVQTDPDVAGGKRVEVALPYTSTVRRGNSCPALRIPRAQSADAIIQVSQLKAALQADADLAPSKQKLILSGMALSNSNSLAFYNITESTVVRPLPLTAQPIELTRLCLCSSNSRSRPKARSSASAIMQAVARL